jgi:hypothetical protein
MKQNTPIMALASKFMTETGFRIRVYDRNRTPLSRTDFLVFDVFLLENAFAIYV